MIDLMEMRISDTVHAIFSNLDLYAADHAPAAEDAYYHLYLVIVMVGVPDMTHRAALAILLCVLSVASLNYFKPHLSWVVFFVEQISFLLSTFKYLVVILLDTRTVQGHGTSNGEVEKLSFMGILLVALDLIFFVGSLVSLIAIVWLVKCEFCNHNSRNPELLEQQKEFNMLLILLKKSNPLGIKLLL